MIRSLYFKNLLNIFKGLLENPLCISEVRRGLRSIKIFVIQTIYVSILTFALYLVWSISVADINSSQNVGKNILLTLSIIQFILVALICPSFTCGAITSEKERQTYDLLVTSLLTPGEIISGKVMYSLAYSSLFLLSSLPLTCTVFFFGGVSPGEIFLIYISLFIFSLLVSLMGIYFSARMKTTNASLRTMYVTICIPGLFLVQLIPAMLYSGSIPTMPFIIFQLPLWFVGLINVVFAVLYLYISTVKLIQTPSARPTVLLRMITCFFLFFNIWIISGFIYQEMANSDFEQISIMFTAFYTGMMILAFFAAIFFCCDPPENKKSFFIRDLFLSSTRISGFFTLIIFFIILVFSSSILLIHQISLFPQESVMISSLLSILLISLTILIITLIGRIIAKYYNRKTYSQVVVFIFILLISFLPIFFFIPYEQTGEPLEVTSFVFVEPVISLISIWVNDDESLKMVFAGENIPIFYGTFIIYSIFLLILLVINKFVRGKNEYLIKKLN